MPWVGKVKVMLVFLVMRSSLGGNRIYELPSLNSSFLPSFLQVEACLLASFILLTFFWIVARLIDRILFFFFFFMRYIV